MGDPLGASYEIGLDLMLAVILPIFNILMYVGVYEATQLKPSELLTPRMHENFVDTV